MKFFVKHLNANRDGALIMLAFQGGLFLLGVLMVVCINAFFNDEQDYATIGSLVALMGTVFGGLVRGCGAPARYRMAVSMGHTRRAYLLADPVITAINTLIGIGAAWVLNKLELWLYSLLYPDWELDLDVLSVFTKFFKPQYILLFAAGVCLLDFCLGAFQLRFGSKAFAAIWFPLCFGPMVVINSVNAAKEGGGSLLALLGRGILFLAGLLRPAMWAGVGGAALIALVALSAACYCRSEVRL